VIRSWISFYLEQNLVTIPQWVSLFPKWAWSGSRDLISKFWDPLITFEGIEISASDLVQANRTDPACVRIIKRPPKWAKPGLRDPISKCWDPLITFKLFQQSPSNLVQS